MHHITQEIDWNIADWFRNINVCANNNNWSLTEKELRKNINSSNRISHAHAAKSTMAPFNILDTNVIISLVYLRFLFVVLLFSVVAMRSNQSISERPNTHKSYFFVVVRRCVCHSKTCLRPDITLPTRQCVLVNCMYNFMCVLNTIHFFLHHSFEEKCIIKTTHFLQI